MYWIIKIIWNSLNSFIKSFKNRLQLKIMVRQSYCNLEHGNKIITFDSLIFYSHENYIKEHKKIKKPIMMISMSSEYQLNIQLTIRQMTKITTQQQMTQTVKNLTSWNTFNSYFSWWIETLKNNCFTPIKINT